MSVTAFATSVTEDEEEEDEENVRSPVHWRRRIRSSTDDEEDVASPRRPPELTIVSEVTQGEVLLMVSPKLRAAVTRLLLFPSVTALCAALVRVVENSYLLGELNVSEDMKLWTAMQQATKMTIDKCKAGMVATATAFCERLQLASGHGFGVVVFGGGALPPAYSGSVATVGTVSESMASGPASSPVLDEFLGAFLASLVQFEAAAVDDVLGKARPKIVVYV